eukprot:Trichotokara_eunicae@DN11068_c0_g1_i2.p1
MYSALIPQSTWGTAVYSYILDNDVAVEACTGSGKTLAYLLPLVQKVMEHDLTGHYYAAVISGIIMAPTRELAQQIHLILMDYLSFVNKHGHDIMHAIVVGGEKFPRTLKEFSKLARVN